MPTQTNAVGMERKLAAIFSTDVAGYSRLMGDDEEAAILTLTVYREVISSSFLQFQREPNIDKATIKKKDAQFIGVRNDCRSYDLWKFYLSNLTEALHVY